MVTSKNNLEHFSTRVFLIWNKNIKKLKDLPALEKLLSMLDPFGNRNCLKVTKEVKIYYLEIMNKLVTQISSVHEYFKVPNTKIVRSLFQLWQCTSDNKILPTYKEQ